MSPNAMSDVDVESSGSPVQQSNMTDRKGKDAGNSPNARSASISVADGEDTQGVSGVPPFDLTVCPLLLIGLLGS